VFSLGAPAGNRTILAREDSGAKSADVDQDEVDVGARATV
jgi:hypothetical protein